MNRISRLYGWALAFALLAGSPVLAAGPGSGPEPLSGAGRADMLNAVPDTVRRLTVAVRVNGMGPFPFLIDTGADRTVVSRELAERLGLPSGKGAVLHDMLGVTQVRTALIDRIDLGQRTLEDVRAAVLPEDNLGVAGIIGIDSLHDRHVLIDLIASRIILEPTPAEIESDGDEIVVRARRRLGQLILVDASTGGIPVSVVLDTGAENSIGNGALRRLLARREGRKPGTPTEIVSVTGRSMAAEFLVIGEMKLGGATVRNIPVAFADVHSFRQFGLTRKPAMLLGMDVLRQFEQVSIDFRRGKVRLMLPGKR